MVDRDESAAPTFRPSRDGLAQVLGKLEAEVMEYIWTHASGPVPARQVADAVGEERGVQHITIVTVLNNLCRKRLLRRERAGRAFVYEPRLSRDDYLRKVSREVLSGVVKLGPSLAVSSFVDVLEEMDPEELRRLKKILAERRAKEPE